MRTPLYLQRLEQVANEIYKAALGLPTYLEQERQIGPLPRTTHLVLSMLHQTDLLHYSIDEAARNRDMIGCKTLTRALIEQYVRFLYLFVRVMRKPTDDLAMEYRDTLHIIEHFACKRAKAIARKDFDDGMSRASLWTVIQAEKPYFQKYTLNDVNRLLDEFSWEAITIYLEQEKQTNEEDELSGAIYEHAYLVCSQHGGLTLNRAIVFDTMEQQEDEFEQLCIQGLRLATEVKSYTCILFGQFNNNFHIFHERILQAAEKIGQPEKRSGQGLKSI